MGEAGFSQRIYDWAFNQGPLFVFAFLVLVTGYWGVWHWRRELKDMTDERNYWRSKAERLEGDLSTRQRQLEELFTRGIVRGGA